MAAKKIILNIKVDAVNNALCDPDCPFKSEAYCRLFGVQLTEDYNPDVAVQRCAPCIEGIT